LDDQQSFSKGWITNKMGRMESKTMGWMMNQRRKLCSKIGDGSELSRSLLFHGNGDCTLVHIFDFIAMGMKLLLENESKKFLKTKIFWHFKVLTFDSDSKVFKMAMVGVR